MVRRLMVAALIVTAIVEPAAAQDATRGANVFKQCTICHAIGPGTQNKVGSELNDLGGRHSGSVANFSYSNAKEKSGIVWGEMTFNLQTVHRQPADNDRGHEDAFRRSQGLTADQRSLNVS
jgi:cytochrome c2